MPYFTAVLTAEDDRWSAVDVDLTPGPPEEVGDLLRNAVEDEAEVLAVLEREDEWFAVLRADREGEVRVFVSDAIAATGSRYADLFAELPPPEGARRTAAAGTATGDAAADPDAGDDVSDTDTGARAADDAEETPAAVVAADLWAGDADLLADLGVSAEDLVRIAGEAGDPAVATTEIAEHLGAGDVLESLR
ncbi:hypothetical protein ACFFKU_14185 [Kineococcus gynurae]|uniref:tRNA adenosine deaminase-associated protein n=1 Tax=Kineococcus gynurae TaxID=452979 RepID=A0ABV5LU15_9ACTN